MSLSNSFTYSDFPAILKSDVYSTTIVINPGNSKSSYIPRDIIIFDYNSGQYGFIVIKHVLLHLM